MGSPAYPYPLYPPLTLLSLPCVGSLVFDRYLAVNPTPMFVDDEATACAMGTNEGFDEGGEWFSFDCTTLHRREGIYELFRGINAMFTDDDMRVSKLWGGR